MMFIRFLFPFAVISFDDGFYQSVTYHVFFIQLNMCDAIYIFQDADSLFQTASLILWKVYLGYIARDDRLGICTDAGQEHFDLQIRCILSFVKNNKCIIER